MSALGLVARVARAALATVYAPFRLLRRRRKVVFVSRQSDQPPPDFAAVVARLSERVPDLEVVVLARTLGAGPWGVLRYLPHLLRQMWHVASARVVVLDTYCIVVSAVRHSPGLTVLQMWHALGALKVFGYSSLDLPGGRSSEVARAMRMHAGYDRVLVSGPAAREAFADAFRTPVDRMVVAPLPRVDVLRDPAARSCSRDRVLARFPELGQGRVVLYAPTLDRAEDERAHGAGELASLATAFDAAGLVPVIKPHPHSRARLPACAERYRGISTQELMSVADVFATDCSSAAVEAGLAGLPVAFLWPRESADQQELYVDLRQVVPDAVAEDVAGLIDILTVHRDRAERAGKDLVRFFVTVPAHGSAADGVTDVVLGALGD